MATWRQARRSRVALSPSRRPLSATTGRARRETEKMDAAALPLVTSGRSARAVGDSGASCDSDGGSGGGLTGVALVMMMMMMVIMAIAVIVVAVVLVFIIVLAIMGVGHPTRIGYDRTVGGILTYHGSLDDGGWRGHEAGTLRGAARGRRRRLEVSWVGSLRVSPFRRGTRSVGGRRGCWPVGATATPRASIPTACRSSCQSADAAVNPAPATTG